MTRRRLLNAVVFAAVVVLTGGVASADISKGVIAALRGQLIVTKGGDLPEGKTDQETIGKIKAARLTELKGEPNGEVKMWTFNYAAFLNKTGASSLKLEFWRDGKSYAADKNLSGVDPKSAVLTGEISIDEDENISPGHSYTLKLVAGTTLLATTTLMMK